MAGKVYFQDKQKGILKTHLFDEEAQHDAKRLLKAEVPSVQVRRYFGEIRALQTQLASLKESVKEDAFARVRPYLGLLKAKIHYGRRNNKKRNNDMVTLSEVLSNCIDGVEDEETFNAMVKYVEAMVAYFTPESQQSRSRR